MIKLFLLSVTLFQNPFGSFISDTTTIYHRFEKTTSSWYVAEWNIDSNSLPDRFIVETVDESGRVIELKFFENGELISSHLCSYDAIVTFEYPNDSTIVTTQWTPNGSYGGSLECGSPTRKTFTYSPDSYILTHLKSDYLLTEYERSWWLSDEGGYTEKELDSFIDESNSESDKPNYIYWYFFSYNKLNGVFPVDKYFEFRSLRFSNKSEATKARILETLPKQFVH